jgi:hypothetical protein
MRDERWHPASEVPKCETGITRGIVLYANGASDQAWYIETANATGWHLADHGAVPEFTRWRYWPEPPTPEEERRRELEERVTGMAAKYVLDHILLTVQHLWPAGAEDVLREMAAKGGVA